MRCPECGGRFEKRTITYDQPWGEEELYRFKHVPAWVCIQCGAIYLDGEISEAIDRTIERHQPPDEYQRLPVFRMENVVA